jgi:multiple sugar transport system substrate-binding protein
MRELVFSTTRNVALNPGRLDQALERFTALHHVPVQLLEIDTEFAMQELNNFAIHQTGADVSQMGTTWLRGFVDMNALRPLSLKKDMRFGQSDHDVAHFIPILWQSTHTPDAAEPWAIPWLADVRMVYYRRDLLARAGVEERTAFQTPQTLEETLHRLQASGVACPWAVPTRFSWRTLHNVASWIWAANGDFVSPDGKHVLLTQPQALAGLKSYFSLTRFMSDQVRNFSTALDFDDLFLSGEAAVIISSGYLSPTDQGALQPKQVGVAAPLGIPFIGGSHLVIWQHTKYDHDATQLVHFLTRFDTQQSYGLGNLLPVRLDALSALGEAGGYAGEFVRQLLHWLPQGRLLPSVYLWNVIEARVAKALAQVWEEVLATHEPDLEAILQRQLLPVTQFLDMMLRNR